MITDYQAFLERKQKNHVLSGFDINESDLNESLFNFQKFIVKRALKAGKYAIFADCGLGKTLMQLEWAHRVYLHTNKPVLILAPLAVSGQTISEGVKFGIPVNKYGTDSEIQISNYEQLQNIDCSLFSGIVLDESSILKNFEGAIKNTILDKFANTPYKLACTATPSPNDPMELGNHSDFLDVMSRNGMLAMYFVHDGGDTSKWRLKGHAESKFWEWVASWAVVITKPSDLGYSDIGFELPPLHIHEMCEISVQGNDSIFMHGRTE
jgi:hypothetical protein